MAWMVYSRTGLRTLDVEDIAVHVIVQCIQYPTAVIGVTIGICDAYCNRQVFALPYFYILLPMLRIITICNFTFHYDVSWYVIHVMLSTYFEVKLYDNSVL